MHSGKVTIIRYPQYLSTVCGQKIFWVMTQAQWRRGGSNPWPQACKARALPNWATPPRVFKFPIRPNLKRRFEMPARLECSNGWWAWVDLNYWPHAYQACALTNWATGPPVHFCRKIKPLGLWVKWLYEVRLTACSYCWQFAEIIAAKELILKYQFASWKISLLLFIIHYSLLTTH